MFKQIVAFFGSCLVLLPCLADAQQGPAAPRIAVVHKHAVLKFETLEPLDSTTSKEGDAVRLRLTRPLVVDGITLLPEGTMVQGKVTKVKPAAPGCRYGSIKWKLDKVPFLDSSNAKTRVLFTDSTGRMDVPFIRPDGSGMSVGQFFDDAGIILLLSVALIILSPIVVSLLIHDSFQDSRQCSSVRGSDYVLPAGSTVAVVVREDHKVRY